MPTKKEELEGLKDKFIDRFRIIYLLSRERTDAPINSGRINTNKLSELTKLIDYKNVDEFFICGPEEMIFNVKDFLETTIERSKIHFELFFVKGWNYHLSTILSTWILTSLLLIYILTLIIDFRCIKIISPKIFLTNDIISS